MKLAFALVAPAFVALALGCTRSSARDALPAPLASTNSILRFDRLAKMPGATAFDALHTLPSYLSRTMRVPAPRLVLVLDGMRTSNLDFLNVIRASDLFEIRVVGESQSIGYPGEVEIVVTTRAAHRGTG